MLYIVEGIGLLLAKHWAEYFTIIATASLIPVELYEVARKTNLLRLGILLVNIAIVLYLFNRLRAENKDSAIIQG
jgi:uncharacterized membrane protein (DUF2068 family)